MTNVRYNGAIHDFGLLNALLDVRLTAADTRRRALRHQASLTRSRTGACGSRPRSQCTRVSSSGGAPFKSQVPSGRRTTSPLAMIYLSAVVTDARWQPMS